MSFLGCSSQCWEWLPSGLLASEEAVRDLQAEVIAAKSGLLLDNNFAHQVPEIANNLPGCQLITGLNLKFHLVPRTW